MSCNRRSVLKAAVGGALAAGLPLGLRAQDRSSLKLGLAMPLTGSQSAYGKDQVTAAQSPTE